MIGHSFLVNCETRKQRLSSASRATQPLPPLKPGTASLRQLRRLWYISNSRRLSLPTRRGNYKLILRSNMSAVAGRVASKVGSAAGQAAGKAAQAGSGGGKESVLKKGAKRDPELYVCFFAHLKFNQILTLTYMSRSC